jgi:hypothetical protein
MKSTLTGRAAPDSFNSALALAMSRGESESLLVIGMIGIDPLIAGLELAVEHHLIDRLAIDRQIERLPHLGGLAERPLALSLPMLSVTP